MRVLVTGATGFVGRHLCTGLLAAGHDVVAAVRRAPEPALPDGIDIRDVGEIGPGTDWRGVVDDIDGIVHLSARTHVMKETAMDPERLYRDANVEATRRLAMAAATAGVGRLVFLSSIKVNGEATQTQAFGADDPPAPEDVYGRTKHEAEVALIRATEAAGTRAVIVRAPLVYGPGVKGNFLRLLDAVSRGRLLPLGAIDNRRSLIYVGNLVDALIVCLTHAEAPDGAVFLARDPRDVSVPELLRAMGAALNRPARLMPVPVPLLRLAGALTGRSAAIRRLTGSLQIDDAHLITVLGWSPPYDLKEGLEETAAWYKSSPPIRGSLNAHVS